jgi:hypothetical protein
MVPFLADSFDEYLIMIGHINENLLKHKSVPEGFWATLDPKGERMMERHIHANPYDPLSCFIFWLGVRLLSHTSVGKSHYVFGDELATDFKSTGKKKTSHKDEAFALWMRTRSYCGRAGQRF